MNNGSNSKLHRLIDEWKSTGRVAHLFPRKKRVSLNGSALVKYSVAIIRMEHILTKSIA